MGYLEKFTRVEKVAHDKGYVVVNGEVYSPYRVEPLKKLILSGYFVFNIKISKKTRHVSVHRLVAYQKYGENIYRPGICVRHVDGNSLNNVNENILIGTHSENMMDKPKVERLKCSISAAKARRKFTDVQVDEIRKLNKLGYSYGMLMEMFDITSKGTMSHIINNTYATKV